jgi:hypothetical protein
MRDGKFYARFVSYIGANTVRERLDSVVPGEWNLTLELLPTAPAQGDEQAPEQNRCAFKARLQILGVVREDVGTGKDYKQASTDAFKRVAVRFGIAHELYEMGVNWVQMDGDGKYARPVEDPQSAYERRLARAEAATQGAPSSESEEESPELRVDRPQLVGDIPPCPKCGGRMWDNRIGKRNPKAPDFKCRDRNCDGVIWPPRPAAKRAARQERETEEHAAAPAGTAESGASLGSEEIPF